MQSQYKNRSLNELYNVLENMIHHDMALRHPVEVKEMNQGLALKIFTSSENLTLFFYPGHPVSEFSIIKKGMRLIYPRRQIKFKRHTLGDMMHLITGDDRMRGYSRVIEMYLVSIIRAKDMYGTEVKTS